MSDMSVPETNRLLIELDVLFDHDLWQGHENFEPALARLFSAAVADFSKHMSFNHDFCYDGITLAEATLVFTDDLYVQDLNKQHRGKDKPTNVLSFQMHDEDFIIKHFMQTQNSVPPLLLGDIFVAFETCQQEAKAQGKRFDHHVFHLALHGFLHLLGFDHMAEGDAEEMEAKEIELLAQIGVPNPYAGER